MATILVSVLFLQHFAKQRFWRLPGDERHVRRRRFLTPPAAWPTRPAPRARRDAAGRLSRCRGGSVPYLSLGGCFVKITYIFAYMAMSYSARLPNVEVYNCEFGSPEHTYQVSGPPDTPRARTGRRKHSDNIVTFNMGSRVARSNTGGVGK